MGVVYQNEYTLVEANPSKWVLRSANKKQLSAFECVLSKLSHLSKSIVTSAGYELGLKIINCQLYHRGNYF